MGLKRSADGPSSPNKRRKGEDAGPIRTSATTGAAPETTPEKQTAQSALDSKSTVVQKKEKASLLSLPPELRNKIYEYVVLEKNRIQIVPSLKPPGLLGTCRQTRLEAKKMWLKQNEWVFQVHHLDMVLMHKWARVSGSPARLHVHKEPHWQNLLKWCKVIFDQKSAPQGLSAMGRPDHFYDFLAAISRQAEMSRARTWEECHADLMLWRPLAGAVDARWLQG